MKSVNLSVLPNYVVWFVGVDVEFVLSCRSDPLGRDGDESEQKTLDSVCGLDSKEDRIESNLSKTKNIPPKAVIFSDFCYTFAMSLMILLVLICSTKVSEKSDIAKS